MGTVRIWMRCAYHVTAHRVDPDRPRGRAVEAHLVSERLPVDVQVVDPDEHPVVVTIVRDPCHRDRNDLHRLGSDYDDQPPSRTLAFRILGDGLMRPVMAPGGLTPVRASEFARVEEAARRVRDVGWHHHPLATADLPRPAHAPDRDGTTFRDVREDGREAAVVDLAHRAAGMRVLDGVLWQACPGPVWQINASPSLGAVGLQVVVPGYDHAEVVDVESLGKVTTADPHAQQAPDAYLDVRVPGDEAVALLARLHPTMTVVRPRARVTCESWAPDAGTLRTNLVALGRTLDAHHAATPCRMDPEVRLSLAHLRAVVHRMDRGETTPEEAHARAVAIAGRLADAAPRHPSLIGDRGDPADALLRLRLWEAACHLDAAYRPAPDEDLATIVM